MIDLSRTAITVALGHWDVSDVAVFEAGTPVQMNSDSEVEVCINGDNFFGIAKWNKTEVPIVAIVQEPIITATAFAVPVPLANAGLIVGSERVVIAANPTVALVRDADYFVNYINGTIAAREGITGALSDLGVNVPILVSYRYTLTRAEQVARGSNFQNLFDDTAGSGKITVIQDYAVVYTDQYDTSVSYTQGGSIFVTSDGLFSSVGTGAKVGIVVESPSATNPLLGLQIG